MLKHCSLPTEPPADFLKFNDADWFELGLEIQKGYQDWIQNPID